MKHGDAEWLDAGALLGRNCGKNPFIDIGLAFEVARDFDGESAARGVAHNAAMRRYKARMKDGELQKAPGPQNASGLCQSPRLVRHVHQRHERRSEVE